MGKSLFLSYDLHNEYAYSLDNLVMAKMCYDEGKVMPGQLGFFVNNPPCYSDTLFLEALATYFGPICAEQEFDELESGYIFSLKLGSVVLWEQLKREAEKQNMLKAMLEDEQGVYRYIRRVFCDYYELEMECELKAFGLECYIHGYMGFFNGFLESLIQFDKTLKNELIPKWEEELLHASGTNKNRIEPQETRIYPYRKVG